MSGLLVFGDWNVLKSDGSSIVSPRPRIHTRVLEDPKSILNSLVNKPIVCFHTIDTSKMIITGYNIYPQCTLHVVEYSYIVSIDIKL